MNVLQCLCAVIHLWTLALLFPLFGYYKWSCYKYVQVRAWKDKSMTKIMMQEYQDFCILYNNVYHIQNIQGPSSTSSRWPGGLYVTVSGLWVKNPMLKNLAEFSLYTILKCAQAGTNVGPNKDTEAQEAAFVGSRDCRGCWKMCSITLILPVKRLSLGKESTWQV